MNFNLSHIFIKNIFLVLIKNMCYNKYIINIKRFMMSKYEVLWNYIKDNNKASYIMTFDEIKNIFRV